jgi:glycerol kinase
VEQDPEELLESVRSVVEVVLDQHRGRLDSDVQAGLATQRASIVCWDTKTGDALTPVLSWQDTRCEELLAPFEGMDEEIQARTGLRLTPHYGVGKLLWCLANVTKVQEARANRRLACGPLSSFLLFRLVEGRPFKVDPANAGRMLLFNRADRRWDPKLLELFGVPAELLPQTVPTQHRFGDLSIGDGRISLRVVTGDQSAVPFCLGEPRRDTVYVNLGTGGFLQRPVLPGSTPPDGILASVILDDARASVQVFEATVNGAGSALNRYPVSGSEDRLFRTARPPLFLNGVSGLGSPWWNARFQSRFTSDASVSACRDAVAESILFLIRVNLETMSRDGEPPTRIVAAGGLSGSDELIDRLAGLCGLPVHRLDDLEATAAGVGFLVAGRPSSWSSSPVTLFEPVREPALDDRYHLWLDAMKQELAGY